MSWENCAVVLASECRKNRLAAQTPCSVAINAPSSFRNLCNGLLAVMPFATQPLVELLLGCLAAAIHLWRLRARRAVANERKL